MKEGENICAMAKKQPRKFWKAIKRKFWSKSTQSENLTAEDLFKHFKTVFGDDMDNPSEPPPPSTQHPPRPDPPYTTHPELFAEITEAKLKEAVFHTKK